MPSVRFEIFDSQFYASSRQSAEDKESGGSLITIDQSPGHIHNCTFIGNPDDDLGTRYRAVTIVGAGSTVNVTDSLFENLAESGGAGAMLIAKAGTNFLSNNVFRNNRASQGGALMIEDTVLVVLSHCSFINNQAINGDPSIPIQPIKG